MKKPKLITVVGTRPEIIRLSEIIKKFDKFFDHRIVFTNQNYSKELSNFFFNNFNVKIDYHLNTNNNNPIKCIAEIFNKFETILTKEKPSACFVLGDTNSALSMIVAKKKQIPIFHYEAGNRCNDERVPEEINRKIIDHISDVNFTYSEAAKYNLIKEGLQLKYIFNLGSPLCEVYNANKTKIQKSNILKKLKLKKNNYFVASVHREENLENKYNFNHIINFLNEVSNTYKKRIIFSAHPRTLKILKNDKIKISKNIMLSKPFDFFDYCKLQTNSIFTFSDSGSISEESYIMKFRAINLRETHERHEAMEQGIVPMLNFKKNNNVSLIKNSKDICEFSKLNEYEQLNVSDKISKIILSYISNINTFKYLK